MHTYLSPTPDEKVIIEFLNEHPESFSSRKKKDKPDPTTTKGQTEILGIMRRAKEQKLHPSQPSTVPDHAVSVILGAWYEIPKSRWEQVKLEHQYSMVAENLVGELLERYVDHLSKENNLGWARAYGDVIKSIDFIKKEGGEWKLLQIKNRDNSENSSSQSVRKGTSIIKWFRTFSRTGNTNWENFPDNKLKELASEDKFLDFVKNKLEQEKV